jgi:hypothetical protein
MVSRVSQLESDGAGGKAVEIILNEEGNHSVYGVGLHSVKRHSTPRCRTDTHAQCSCRPRPTSSTVTVIRVRKGQCLCRNPGRRGRQFGGDRLRVTGGGGRANGVCSRRGGSRLVTGGSRRATGPGGGSGSHGARLHRQSPEVPARDKRAASSRWGGCWRGAAVACFS